MKKSSKAEMDSIKMSAGPNEKMDELSRSHPPSTAEEDKDSIIAQRKKKLLHLPKCYELPEEVWLLIFSDFSPDDFHSASLAFPTWDHIMMSKKPSVLLPIIVQITMDYLPLSTLLNCRLVSKSVKAVVDEVLQYDAAHPTLPLTSKLVREKNHKDTRFKLQDVFQYIFKELSQVSRFLAHFQSHPGNPFLTRLVDFGNELVEENEGVPNFHAMEQPCQSILSTFGDHIWSLSIGFSAVFTDEFVSLFASFLKEVPHLQQLSPYGGHEWETLDADEDEEEQMMRIMRNFNFPTLNKLSFISVESFGDPKLVLLLLRLYGSRLRKFECNGYFMMMPQEVTAGQVAAVASATDTDLIPNVEDFSFTCDNYDDTRIAFPQLSKNFALPLSKLKIESVTHPLILSDVLRMISRLTDTLEELEIFASLKTNRIVLDLKQLYLEEMAVFPKLKEKFCFERILRAFMRGLG
ncbi:unnamed protein product [Orchesella dallaii]|uniref:F-box domain-containing protein n=1 Tax=Orchesella dallaii TaxID=48710 RepID=A0ABP1RUT5_9HEXA